MQARFGDALHCLLIAPEVRGPNGTPLGNLGTHYTAGGVGNVLDFVPNLLNVPT